MPALIAGVGASATVSASAPSNLDAWVDFNRNGIFEPNEQIAASLPLAAGNNNVTFAVPPSATAGTTFARFRLSTSGGLAPTGPADDGEVEDYSVVVTSPAPGSGEVTDDPSNPGDHILIVTGTAKNDSICVKLVNGHVRVTLNGRTIGTFSPDGFERIVVRAGAGNDSVVIAANINKPSELNGEAGNDSLVGSNSADTINGGHGNDSLVGLGGQDTISGNEGNDVVNGGSGNDFVFGGLGNDKVFGETGNDFVLGEGGNDFVYGGAGRDILVGGTGVDQLFGEAGDDILVGGTTSADSDAALAAQILAQWTSANPYNVRVTNILALGVTINEDNAIDTLFGQGNQDWFLVGLGDKVRDKAANEIVT